MRRSTGKLTPAWAVVALAAFLLAGCSAADEQAPAALGQATPPTTTAPAATPTGSAPVSASSVPDLKVGATVTTGLSAPWGLAFLPDGSALVTQRDDGQLLRVPAGGGRAEPVGTVEGVVPDGEGGLLGIAVPAGPSPSYVMVYATAATDNRVIRIGWDGRRLGAQRAVLTGIPKGAIHDGGRLRFGPDGYLYVSTGDTGDRDLAQDGRSLAGKILRITGAGAPAPGNPVPGSPVWSLGHRNVQGLAFDSAGRLWASEFGQDDLDELNVVRGAANYGWPLFEGPGEDPAYVDPRLTWPTSQASPSGIAIVDDVVYVATLRGRRLWQVPTTDGRAGEPRAWFTEEYGRLRAVEPAPGGGLWLMTNNTDGRGDPRPGDDRILQVTLTP
ncbi:MAG TPA: PQQ-dependent sugar dehydrogenase [Candidatus Nanopelagicales bacterium]|nr:PQQ-dependent sugar dehydrogenase [Candidatus Nanopelagicales bacterium]